MTKERPREPSGWITARRYDDARSARQIYESARDRLLIREDLDASVLRFTLDGVSHVAVVGGAPLDERGKRLVEDALGDGGEPASLPAEIIEQLKTRRRNMTRLGFDYVERRTDSP